MQTANNYPDGGLRIGQTAAAFGAPTVPAPTIPAPSASGAANKILVADTEAAALFGVSVRKFHDLRPTLGLQALVLGPRCVRYLRSELEAAVLNLPRQSAPTEPAQLLRGKIEKRNRAQQASVKGGRDA